MSALFHQDPADRIGIEIKYSLQMNTQSQLYIWGNKIIYVGIYFSRAPGQVPQGQPWSRTRISWAGRREITGINSNSWPQEPTMGIIWTHTDISMSSHKKGTELSCSNSSKREFLPGNPRLQRPWSSSHWTGLFQANLLLDSLANQPMAVHSATVFPFVFLRKHQPGIGVCSQSVPYLQSTWQMPSVVISLATSITSPQAPKLFRRIFEDYLIIQSVLHVLTLRVWHIKKEEGRNDLSGGQTMSRSRSKWTICEERWGCFEPGLWKSCLDPASKSFISSANTSAVLIKSSELLFLGKWKWWQLLEPLNGHKSRAGLTPNPGQRFSFSRGKWAAHPPAQLRNLLEMLPTIISGGFLNQEWSLCFSYQKKFLLD